MARFFRDRSPARAVRVLELFRDELSDRIATLEAIAAGKDEKALKLFAHAARGSGAMLGAQRLAELSKAIESGCIDGRPDWDRVESLRRVILDTRDAYSLLATAALPSSAPDAIPSPASRSPGLPDA